ncbi:MAG: Rieske (2Fe-2S) protein [Polyangiaceae bacterium]|jgi:nitrite reductase/ring-hydroxylating ferredoxin subunit|nr:Rieske (2Fe-2S) protein [Polyangiaceae bacterium]
MQPLDWMHLSEIVPGRMNVKVLSDGRKAVVVRRGDALSVYSEICPHLGADLTEGQVCEREGTLRCRWHGYLFSLADGTLQDNPNERMMSELRTPSEHYRPDRAPAYRLSTLPHEVRGDRLYFLPGRAVRRGGDE